jgi:lysophospholipase L1-like esterase
MRALIIALVAIYTGIGGALAAEDSACASAANFVRPSFGLPHVAVAMKNKRMDVIVIGSASSLIAGSAGPRSSYPLRLESALTERFKGIAVKVSSYARTGQTAIAMEKGLKRILDDEKPALVIWQTGTVDAMRGIDPEDFRVAINEGVDTIRSHNADVVFMNMQYSPRTESMIPVGTYADIMLWVSLQHRVQLFDRFAIMRQWHELGTFDLAAVGKNVNLAERVHGCIGQLLADLIIESVGLEKPATSGTR